MPDHVSICSQNVKPFLSVKGQIRAIYVIKHVQASCPWLNGLLPGDSFLTSSQNYFKDICILCHKCVLDLVHSIMYS